MKRRLLARLSAFAGALTVASLVATPAAAQGNSTANATVNATAEVAAAISASGTDLDFGTVFAGISKTVATADATPGSRAAARYTINGSANAPVSISFSSVPTDLVSGANTMPIGSWSACANTTSSGAAGSGCTTAVAVSAATSPAALSGTGELYVFVGAAVTPGASQVAGTYAAQLTMVVQYTGN